MKKIALTSVLALFAVSGAQAASGWFVGGSAGFDAAKNAHTVYSFAPEIGFKVNDTWDVGLDVGFYKSTATIGTFDFNRRDYIIAPFARLKVAEVGKFSLLFKGSVGSNIRVFSHDGDSESITFLDAYIIPMVTYNVTDAFVLHANLNFLGVYADARLKNDTLGVTKDWSFGFGANADNVLNTSNFQVGFTYHF